MNEKATFVLKITLDQILVTQIRPFFFTETTKEEFSVPFKKKLMPKILASFDHAFSKGFKLPFGTIGFPQLKNTQVTIKEECIVVDAEIDESDDYMPKITKITLQDPQAKAVLVRKYPVVYHISSDNSVKIVDAECNDDELQVQKDEL